MVPGYNKIPKFVRMIGGLALGGFTSKVGNKLSNEVISIFHGTSSEAIESIMKQGFKSSEGGAAFFTNFRKNAEWFASAKVNEVGGSIAKLLRFDLAKDLLDIYKNNGLLTVTSLSNGEKYFEFTAKAIDRLVNLALKGEKGVKIYIENITK